MTEPEGLTKSKIKVRGEGVKENWQERERKRDY